MSTEEPPKRRRRTHPYTIQEREAKIPHIIIPISIREDALFYLDRYLHSRRIRNRASFIRQAIYDFLGKLDIWKDEELEVEYDRSLGRTAQKLKKKREADPGSWTTDPGDFGEPDENPDEPASSAAESTETGLPVHGSRSSLDLDWPEPSGDNQTLQ